MVRLAVKGLTADPVLMVQERHQSSGEPFWTLPGGGVKWKETPEMALQREISEEIGCDANVGEWVDAVRYEHSDGTVSEYQVYTVEIVGDPDPRDGVEDVRRVTSLPDNTLEPFRDFLTDYRLIGSVT